ncbi:hypothetical protein BN1723_010737, partial [Verticillium longisporum]
MSDQNTNQQPGLVAGHAEYIKGAAESAIGSVTGSHAWTSSGEQDKAHAASSMKAAAEARDASTQGYGKIEEAAGKTFGCEGIKSKLRNDIIPEENTSMNINPLSAFRAYVHHDDLMSDPITAPIFKETATNVWAGYNRHVIIYPCGGGMYTLGATHPANHNENGDRAMEWSRAATVSQAEEEYKEWNPIIKRILHHTKEVGKWRLAESGRVVLMGDNAHAMLQFLAQGAAMATEDAGSLSVAVGRAKSAEDLPRVLKAYERARKWRCEAVSAQARRNGDMIHMPDGEEQENRDREMSQLAQTGVWKADTGPMFDAEFRNFLYNHNVIEH